MNDIKYNFINLDNYTYKNLISTEMIKDNDKYNLQLLDTELWTKFRFIDLENIANLYKNWIILIYYYSLN